MLVISQSQMISARRSYSQLNCSLRQQETVEVALISKDRIRRLREQKGWDQKQLGQAANIDASVISRLERGQQTGLRLSFALALADALGVSIYALLEEQRPEATMAPEWEAVVNEVNGMAQETQRQAASILKAYLGTLSSE